MFFIMKQGLKVKRTATRLGVLAAATSVMLVFTGCGSGPAVGSQGSTITTITRITPNDNPTSDSHSMIDTYDSRKFNSLPRQYSLSDSAIEKAKGALNEQVAVEIDYRLDQNKNPLVYDIKSLAPRMSFSDSR